jgi:inner membrane protein
MDNICHTLVGAALGEAGLRRRTRWGTATLMIASNLPDVDVLVFATSTPSVAFRRGWTHGILADVLLPPLLTGLMMLIASRARARQSVASAEPLPRPSQLLLLSYIGVILHVLMDLLNTYGVRLLMPFSQRWFYGDVLFIVDPWLWMVLGAGIWLARRQHSARPARGALLLAATYVLVMIVAARAARAEIVDRWQQAEGSPPRAVMVGPVPVTPLRRQVIIDAGDHYETGTFTWEPRSVHFDERTVAKNDTDPRVAATRDAPNIRAFLIWSRFPFWMVEPVTGGTRVTVGDMRFNGGPAALRNFTQSVVVSGSPGS